MLHNQTYIGKGAAKVRMHNGAGVRMYNSLFAHYIWALTSRMKTRVMRELFLFGEMIHNNRPWAIGDSSGITK